MDRSALLLAVLEELTAHTPAGVMRYLRHWSAGPLSLIHLNVLTVLESDGPTTMRGLAEALDVSQASATGIIDRMEQRSLVERSRDDRDRRLVRVALTETGRRLIDGVAAERRGRLEMLLEGLTDAELQGFLLGARALRRAREAHFASEAGAAREPARRGGSSCRGGRPMIGILRRYLAPYRRPIAFVLTLLLAQALANLYLPELYADIINNGVAKGDSDYIVRIGGLMLVVTAVLGVASIIGVYWSARISMGFGRDLRAAIFRSVESFSQVEVNQFGAASLITRNTNDVQQIQQLVLLALNVMISAPILTIGGVIMALRQDVPAVGPAPRDRPAHGAAHRLRDEPCGARCSRPSSASSTGSTWSCARPWPGSA